MAEWIVRARYWVVLGFLAHGSLLLSSAIRESSAIAARYSATFSGSSQLLGRFCQESGHLSCGGPAVPDLLQGHNTGFVDERQRIWLDDSRLVQNHHLFRCIVSSQTVRLIAHATSAPVPAAPISTAPGRPSVAPAGALSPGAQARLSSHALRHACHAVPALRCQFSRRGAGWHRQDGTMSCFSTTRCSCPSAQVGTLTVRRTGRSP